MPKLKDPRVVKIFFSSPFGGMEEEREELTRRYFPSLHHLCNSRGLQFAAVDMRWGITSESSDNAQVINICLREIDRSDMFVGFFGQRYGWHGAEDKVLQGNFDNAVGRYPWLNNYRDKSVTELEFLHGFLNNPGHLPATIFFRDKSYDDLQREEGIEKGDKKQVFKYSAESDLSTKLMDDLKERIWENREKSLGVYMDYKTPAEAAEIMYNNIMAHLTEVLLADLQLTVMTHQQELMSQHNAFLASRCNIYVHGESYMQQLNKQLLAGDRQHVLVTGEAGCGKSALLCNWITSLRETDQSAYAIVYHFVGFADSSTDVRSILSRLVEEFENLNHSMIGGTSKVGETSGETPGSDIRQLMQRLVAAMSAVASQGKTPILVLDGLGKITTASKITKVLFWLPTNFPKSSFVVVSTVDRDQQTIEKLTDLKYVTIHIEPLPETQKREMCVKTLQESGKELSPHQLDRIVAAEMTKNPLFLNVTLSELVSFGYFRLLDKKIDSLVTSASIEELLLKVLERLAQDYNVEEYEGELVQQVLGMIVLSKHGMSEEELKLILSIPDHIWSPLYFAIEKLVINQSGKIKFAFRELEEAIQKAYLLVETTKNKYIRMMIDFFKDKLTSTSYPASCSASNHSVFELPWLWLQLGDVDGLADCLSNFDVFSQLQRDSIFDLISLWSETGLSGNQIVDRLSASFDRRVAEVYTDLEKKSLLKTSQSPGLMLETYLHQVDEFLQTAGYHGNREIVILRQIRVLKEGLVHGNVEDETLVKSALFSSRYRLACLYCQLPHSIDKGISLHRQLLQDIQTSEGAQSVENVHSTTGNIHHGIGVGYLFLNQYDKVIECCLEAIDHFQQGKSDHMRSEVAKSWSNLGLAYMLTGQLDLALQYLDKCIEAYEEIFFGELPPDVGEVLTNRGIVLRRMDRMDEAEQTYKRSLQMKINALGLDHISTAMGYLNLGSLEMFRNNTQASLDYSMKARNIYEKLGQTWDEPNYVCCLENMLACQTTLEQFTEADDMFQKVLKCRVKERSMDGCMASLYREMANYYLREEMFEKAYHTLYALLNSKHATDHQQYVRLDMALDRLPPDYREKLPVEMSLAYAVDKHPDDMMLLRHRIQDQLVPAGDIDEVAHLLNRFHDNVDTSDQVYLLTHPWFEQGGQTNEPCLQRVVEEGLIKYPGHPGLLLALAKTYRRQDLHKPALDILLSMIEDQQSNFPLINFVADSALRAGCLEISQKYCQLILDRCQNEQIVQSAQQILDYINNSSGDNTKEVEED